jgi:hypothetical protein
MDHILPYSWAGWVALGISAALGIFVAYRR